MTAFLNDHRDRLLLLPPINNSSSSTGTAVRQYVETRIVPGLMAADVCRYDVQSNDFIPLTFAETVEMVVVELSIRRLPLDRTLLWSSRQDPDDQHEPTTSTTVVAAASHPVVHNDDDASGTASGKYQPALSAAVAASKTKPSRKKKAIMVRPKQHTGGSPDQLVQMIGETTAKDNGEQPPKRIKQLDRNAHREESIRILSERYNVPFHDYALYPRKCGHVLDTAKISQRVHLLRSVVGCCLFVFVCGTAGRCYHPYRELQAMTVFLQRHRIPSLAAPNAVNYARTHILPALMEAGVCIYDPLAKQFRPFTYHEAQQKIVQKIYSWRFHST
jgi:hypothetical protein